MMKSLLSRLLGRSERKAERSSPAPEAKDRSLLEEGWKAPERQGAIRRAESFLSELSPELARDLVWGVARRFFGTVVDLPSSERYHHAEPFGLFDHSLEVAECALRASLSRHFAPDTRAYPEDQEHRVPRLRYAAWLFGILHDAGKILHFDVSSPDRSRWNPFVETLEAFLLRHGPGNCRRVWRKGRGLDVHTWHNAYLIASFLTGPVAEYLGVGLIRQLLEQKDPSALEVLALVTEGDHRSTGSDRAGSGGLFEQAGDAPEARRLVGGGEFAPRIPEPLREALRKSELTTNALGADLFVGGGWVLLRYPSSLLKLATLVRERLGREYARARSLSSNEQGARDLASALDEAGALYRDPQGAAWKVKARLEADSSYETLEGVLLSREFLGEPFRDLAGFAGEIEISRPADGKVLPILDWKRPKAVASEAPEAPPPVPAEVPAAKPPQPPVRSPTVLEAAPPIPVTPSRIVSPRTFVSPEVLFEDVRQAILDGTIPPNDWGAACYVLPEVTYIVSPRAFQCLVEKGLYTRDPKSKVSAYLDALSKIPAVRKRPGGRVLTQITVHPGVRRPVWVVAFDTKGLFRDIAELAKVGFWAETPIREVSEAEARAMVKAAKLEAAPPSQEGEAPHA